MAKASALNLQSRSFGVADIGLAVLVVSVVAMLIVPLPTWLLDILLATNLSLSVAILLVVLYVPDALAVASRDGDCTVDCASGNCTLTCHSATSCTMNCTEDCTVNCNGAADQWTSNVA